MQAQHSNVTSDFRRRDWQGVLVWSGDIVAAQATQSVARRLSIMAAVKYRRRQPHPPTVIGFVGLTIRPVTPSRHATNKMSPGPSQLQIQLTAWFMRRTATNGVRRVVSLSAAVATEVGSVRSENQDRVAVARGRDRIGRPFAVAALADGIGGMRQGEECAAMTLGCFFGAIVEEAQTSGEPREWLLHSTHRANVNLHARFHGEGGSTLVAVLVAGDASSYWSSVGDSRVYRALGAKLSQLSMDDTIAGQLGKQPEAGFDQSKLLQFIGIGAPLEPNIAKLDTTATGAVLLTSDGVHFLDSTSWFAQIAEHAPDPGVCVRRLVELSKWCGGPDNASAAMIALGASINEGLPSVDACLEVWDPFGELQVIVDTTRRSATLPNSPAPRDELRADASALPTGGSPPPKIDDLPPNDLGRPRKARGSRKSKGGSGATKEKVAGKDKGKSEVPQLLIEFPNKTN